jgi:hypothetical protein
MSHTQVNELLNWSMPNICAVILFFIPVKDASEAIELLGYLAKTLTFLGAMTVNCFAIRHYYLQIKNTRKQK